MSTAPIKKMNPLAQLDYTKMEYSTIINDIQSILQTYPQYKTEWNDFLSSNAGQMLLETFAYISSKIILRADLIANELFLPTAQDPQSIVRILKLIGYNLTPPSASLVQVLAQTTDGNPITDQIPASHQISVQDLSNQNITFEIYKDIKTYEFDSFNNQSSKILNAFAGSTVTRQIQINSQEDFKFTFDIGPMIDGSFVATLQGYTQPLQEISSLVLFGPDQNGNPRYVLSVDSNFIPTITFGKENFGGAFTGITNGVPETYPTLTVQYRVGGGKNSNVIRGAFNNLFITTATGKVLKLSNTSAGIGGSDGQTIDSAKLYAPLTVKTVNKTVTPEDYTTLLLNQSLVVLNDVNIDTPFEDPNQVPYLFSYIYASPQRNWDDFIVQTDTDTQDIIPFRIPSLLSGETDAQFLQRFNIRLNNFLNIKGASTLVPLITNISGDTEFGFSNAEGLLFPLKDPNTTPYSNEAYELYYNFLADKKITVIENVFRMVGFNPFSINDTVHYKVGFNPDSVLANIKTALRNTFDITTVGLGDTIKVSHIYETIQSVDGVSFSQLNSPAASLVAPISGMFFLLPQKIIDLLPDSVKPNFDITIQMLKD